VLAEIGEKAGVQVSDEEMQRALFDVVRRYPGNQQQEVFEFYRNNANALASLRAPLFEEKVIDHLLTQISVTDQKVSKEELMAEDEEESAGEAKTEKKTKKASAKKADEAGAEEEGRQGRRRRIRRRRFETGKGRSIERPFFFRSIRGQD